MIISDKIKNPSGLYIHIPFCRSKCDYCSFYSMREDASPWSIDSYIERLIEELESFRKSFGSVEFDTVYVGGGTPSILSVNSMCRLLGTTRSLFNIAEGAEVTIEMNPDDLVREKLYGFRDAGVTRIVLGVQSSIVNLRQTLGRRSRNCTMEDLELFFSVPGITRCLDFIAGIPGQTESDIDVDFGIIRRFRPEHVSLYMLSVDDGTPLASRIKPDHKFEEDQQLIWMHAINYLKAHGYMHYEISNFALPGFQSRHNMKYWNFTPYLGAGPGAHSFFNNLRFSNPASLDEYMKPGEFRRVNDYRSVDQLLVEFIMTAVRKLDGFTAYDYTMISGREMPGEIIKRLSDKVAEGLMISDSGCYRLTEKGIFLADRVIYEIVEPFL